MRKVSLDAELTASCGAMLNEFAAGEYGLSILRQRLYGLACEHASNNRPAGERYPRALFQKTANQAFLPILVHVHERLFEAVFTQRKQKNPGLKSRQIRADIAAEIAKKTGFPPKNGRPIEPNKKRHWEEIKCLGRLYKNGLKAQPTKPAPVS